MKNTGNLAARLVKLFLILAIFSVLVVSSVVFSVDSNDAVRAVSRSYEFDYLEWEISALFNKLMQAATRPDKLLSREDQIDFVNYFQEMVEIHFEVENQIKEAIASPEAIDQHNAEQLKGQLDSSQDIFMQYAGITETILQSQTEERLSALGFGFLGQVFPPVLYQVSEMPQNLIISPREEIRVQYESNLDPSLDPLVRDQIETEIAERNKLSALVEPIGGLGAYPAMVMQSADLNWILDTVAHEWTHNWLSFHQLGLRYFQNSDMRTLNETVASISGKELSQLVLARYYPERLPPLKSEEAVDDDHIEETDEKGFNYRAEMRKTRLGAEALLAEGKIDEAEAYMEGRRIFFWQNGYQIRKLNQAFFAFHGSYNDTPGGGEAGSDPVGPAVQAYRHRFDSLHRFLTQVSSLRSFQDLQARMQ